jgi:hypothetical protein
MANADLSQALRFLHLIDGKAKIFTYQTFREKGDNTSNVSAKTINAPHPNELRKPHELGAGVYLTINETNGQSRQSKDIIRIRAIWQEDDDGYDGAFPLSISIRIVDLPRPGSPAALHSRGGDFPCGEGRALPCEVLFLTAEDGLRDTLVPRLMAAEADLTKVHFLTGTKVEGASDDDTVMFDITKDIPALRGAFRDNPAIKILIIDPLTAYLGVGTKARENTDVRRVLTPLIKLIEEFGVLLLANNHLNKSSGKALYRILDSIAFVALGRTIHVVVIDADNRDNRKFICDKSNIGSKPLGLTYIIQKHWIKGELGEEIETSRICWGTSHIDESADEALASETDTGSATAKDETIEFLRLVLAHGPVKVHYIEAEARSACLLGKDQEIRLSKPFRSARAELRVISTREGFGPGAVYYWALPPTADHRSPPDHASSMRATSNTRAHMDSEGTYGEEGDGRTDRESDPEGGASSHVCPRPSYVPSQDEGLHGGHPWCEGNHGSADDLHGLSDIQAIDEELRLRGVYRVPVTVEVSIRQIHRPAISAGPNDNLDDFTNERRLN